MYKQLRAHGAYMEQQIKQLDSLSANEVKKLRAYHLSRVRDFQHERLIHLLVTLFFGWLTLMATAGLFFIATNLTSIVIAVALVALIVILLVVVVAYVIHYYHLENGVQQLYKYTEKLGKS